jgi:hypothetical protein
LWPIPSYHLHLTSEKNQEAFCISKIVTEFPTGNTTNAYWHVMVRNDRQISSALLLFILSWSRYMTTGAWIVGWHCSTDIINTHRHLHPIQLHVIQTVTLLHVSAKNCYYNPDVHKMEYSPHYKEPKGSLPHSQQSANCPYS